jgi:hypothetical protein
MNGCVIRGVSGHPQRARQCGARQRRTGPNRAALRFTFRSVVPLKISGVISWRTMSTSRYSRRGWPPGTHGVTRTPTSRTSASRTSPGDRPQGSKPHRGGPYGRPSGSATQRFRGSSGRRCSGIWESISVLTIGTTCLAHGRCQWLGTE